MPPKAKNKGNRQSQKNGNGRKTAGGSNLTLGGTDLDSAVTSLVRDKMKDLLGESSKGCRGKRLSSQRDEDSDTEWEDDTPPPKMQKQKQTKIESAPEYATQVVILEGVDDDVKKHPTRLSKAFAETKPNVQLHPDGLRMTASGDVLVKPKNPKDCNALLKKDAFPSSSALGSDVKARVPKAQQVTYQVIVKHVDESVTQEEMDEILQRQELPYKSVKRIISRQYGKPTKLFRLILKDEETKKRLLRDGINLDQMHYRCEPAREDAKSYPKVLQCFKCQQLGDHQAAACKNEQKCVLCSGPHRKAECQVTRENFKCANCAGAHAAWSQECPRLRENMEMKKKPTFAQIASATVTPQMLQEIIQEIKQSIVLLITETIARSICEMTYEIFDKSISKLALPMKVAVIATNVCSAANKLGFGPAKDPVDKNTVKDAVVTKLFPNPPATETSQRAGGSAANS